jgi:hypothetical protein
MPALVSETPKFGCRNGLSSVSSRQLETCSLKRDALPERAQKCVSPRESPLAWGNLLMHSPLMIAYVALPHEVQGAARKAR